MNDFKPKVPYDYIDKILSMSHEQFFYFEDMVMNQKKSVTEAYDIATKECLHESIMTSDPDYLYTCRHCGILYK